MSGTAGRSASARAALAGWGQIDARVGCLATRSISPDRHSARSRWPGAGGRTAARGRLATGGELAPPIRDAGRTQCHLWRGIGGGFRSSCGSRSHHVRVEHQLPFRSQNGTKFIISPSRQSLSARPLPDSRAWRPGEAGWCYVMVVGLQALPWRWESQCTCWASARCPRSRWYLSMPDLYLLCVPSPVPLERARIERGRRRAGLGHEFDLVFMSRLRIFAVTGPPVEVGVTMYVLSISSVSEVLMVLTSYYQFTYTAYY